MAEPLNYNVAVIGGGPAGIMAAAIAADNGAKVILLEKNDRLGKKLLITGKGRCNITNNTHDVKAFSEVFGKKGRFLLTAMFNFGVMQVVDFFKDNGVDSKVERGNRIFPVSDMASDVLNALVGFAKKCGVEIRVKSPVKKFVEGESIIKSIILEDGQHVCADNYIICTGGKSYPTTGSSGNGFEWAEKLGHRIVDVNPALVPVIVEERLVEDLQGLSLRNIEINIYQNDKKIDSRFGEAIFTINGLSGPIILDMSKTINAFLAKGPVNMFIDFKPALDYKKLDARILRDFEKMNKKQFKNSLSDLLPSKLIPVIVKASGIPPLKTVNEINKSERKTLLRLLKQFPLTVTSVEGFSKAIVSSGGVSLNEIDPRNMKSKIIENLYFAGEIIDLDGPTGGYNLQVAWSTGYLAGEKSAQKLANKKGKD